MVPNTNLQPENDHENNVMTSSLRHCLAGSVGNLPEYETRSGVHYGEHSGSLSVETWEFPILMWPLPLPASSISLLPARSYTSQAISLGPCTSITIQP